VTDQYFPGQDVTVVATDFPSVDGSVPSPLPPEPPNRNVGHGRIFPRPDGEVMQCGGPVLCRECTSDEGKRATAEALFTASDEQPRTSAVDPGDRPEFNRAVVKAFKTRGEAFPSTDGRLWTRAVLSDGAVLCAWDKAGDLHLWGTVEELAAKAASR
jgi:hypothetical protein